MRSGPNIPEAVADLVRTYGRMLERQFGERLLSIRLFGSYARGDADGESDIDVCVVVCGLSESERTDAIDLAFAAWKNHSTAAPLIPLVWSDAELEDRLRAERRMAGDILSEGVAF